MVNVGGSSFDDNRHNPYLYDQYGHEGVMAETKGYYAKGAGTLYISIFKALFA